MNTPLVSIICLSYNQSDFIVEALNSLIQQDYTNIQIVYLDNQSADDSYVKGLQILNRSGCNFVSHQFPKNVGIPKALNFALKELVAGEYVSMLAADDWLELFAIREKVVLSQANPELGIITAYGTIFYEDTNSFSPIDVRIFKKGNVYGDLLKRNFIFSMGILIKKEVYDKIGYYNENCTIEDWEFSLRATKFFEIGLVERNHFFYRQHSSNYSKGSHKYFSDCILILKQHSDHPNSRIGLKWITIAYKNWLIKNGNQISDLKEFRKLMRVTLTDIMTYFKFWFRIKKSNLGNRQ
ncbi:MAG TPA: glycosyltransferase [Flavobacteriales bacterium]|nr:glycosyltransferase [Flavobacteriales bacterium]